MSWVEECMCEVVSERARDGANHAPYEDEAVEMDLYGHLLTSEHHAKWLASSETYDLLIEEGGKEGC